MYIEERTRCDNFFYSLHDGYVYGYHYLRIEW